LQPGFRAPRGHGELCRPDVRRTVDAEGQSRERDFAVQPFPPGVVDIDDHPQGAAFPRLGQNLAEETLLGSIVPFHVSVVVQVILGEVGEDAQIEIAIVDAPKIDGVGRHFSDDVAHPGVSHLSQDLMHVEGFRRGVRRREDLAAETVIHRAQDARLKTCGLDDRFE